MANEYQTLTLQNWIEKDFHPLFEKAQALLQDKNHILIIPHVDPDPDALAAAAALYFCLSAQGKTVQIGLQKPLFSRYDFITDGHLECYIQPQDYLQQQKKPDAVICVDLGNHRRSGPYQEELSRIPVMNLDHHIDNDLFGQVNIVHPKCSSTCELLFLFLDYLGLPVTLEMAKALYTGIVFDTGAFRYDLTLPRTHLVAARLLTFPIDMDDIHSRLFENLSLSALDLRHRVLQTRQVFFQGKMLVIHLSEKFYEECKADQSDALELIRIATAIEGVEFVVYYHEVDYHQTKISLRCKNNFQVNQLAACFGGGGHNKAAGITMDGNVNEVMDKTLETFVKAFDQYLQSISLQ